LIAFGVWALATLATLAVVAVVVVALPADHFLNRRQRPRAASSSVAGTLARAGRNALGLALIVVGLLLALPGIPGQGILTLLINLMLVDFPGRRRLERRLVAWPGVLPTMNSLRARFRQPPLRPPPTPRA
jgi:hypothetical protein